MAQESVKILLVEDQAIIRLDVHMMLTKMGHKVLDFAASGEDAVTVRRALATEPHGYIAKPATPRVINKNIENFVRDRLLRDIGAETGC